MLNLGLDIKPKAIDQVCWRNSLKDNGQVIDRMLLNVGKKPNIKFGGTGGAGVKVRNKTLYAIMLIKGLKESCTRFFKLRQSLADLLKN